ncbi:histidine phosphatase family protein [Rodentibacter pneumotropicus]|uniref:Phosphoglycerate mutase family protein n=1 Tax=Rodentibacter pneumotropicus TaxID=758 RepID=A0A4S2PF57_9PAST|nr:histidine phosphatase family protein [Rodentibacter pneumotropicus]THA01819.1 phosphoglycerate mutase family protein [Rodentibacter pneumotropicus]THA03058.1 phosphoglycerate mutase family protein [Rodentibacter pneumotropicus]THA09513.1 phosphoglycerate mutase family protein [Rodentibacter pneumotropicus]THA15243.1 phosphoglycerate mutase family protein [Rodentibacter pneumotropicus]
MMNDKQRIILIRHCTPEIPDIRCSAKQAQHYLAEYDSTENIRLSEITLFNSQEVLNDIRMCECIYSSPLPRARITANALFNSANITFCEALKEFNLNIANIPFIALSVKYWFVISRLLWFVGLNRAEKTRVQEKSRVKDFMRRLLTEQRCVIVAHGFVIREIKNTLLKQGFSCTFFEKQGCFSVTILESKGD